MDNSNQNKSCLNCGEVVALTARFCDKCGNKFVNGYNRSTEPVSERKFVEDVAFIGNSPALFKIKRLKNGKKFEIKNEDGNKVFEAILPFKTGLMGIRSLSKMFDPALAGDFKDVTVLALQDDQKVFRGEIVINTADIFNLKNIYNLEDGKYLKPIAINNSERKLLALLNIPYKERIDMFVTGRNHQKRVDQDRCFIETNNGKFKFDLSLEIQGKDSNKFQVKEVVILDSNLVKTMSIIKIKNDIFEMRLYQGFSTFLAHAIVSLVSHVMWPPPMAKPLSTH